MLFFGRPKNAITIKKGIVASGRVSNERISSPICIRESIKIKCRMESEMKTKCNRTFDTSKNTFDHFKIGFYRKMHELRNKVHAIR